MANAMTFLLLTGFIVGMELSAQTGINECLRRSLGSPFLTSNGQLGLVLRSSVNAALVSFIVGSLSLFLMVCVQRPKLKVGRPNTGKNPWWMWLGGFLGAFYVIGNAWISPQIGTGTAVVVGLLGLMSAGLLIDQTGAFHSLKKPVCWQQIVSLASIFGGVCVIRLLSAG